LNPKALIADAEEEGVLARVPDLPAGQP